MGYYVKSQAWKKSLPQWRVQFVSYKKEDTKNSHAKKPKREWIIARDRWPTLGFHKTMSLTDARARAKQLNADAFLRRQEDRLKKIEEADRIQQKRFESVLPPEFVEEFEMRFIRKRDSQTEKKLRRKSRAYTTWRAAQRMIVALGIEPSEWFYHTHKAYDYFHSQKYSIRYLHAILKIANLWGFFICKKMAWSFLPIPVPRGYERQRLIDASYEKNSGVARASQALAPEDLARVRGSLNQKNFNWLFISVWLGLRPQEIGNLKRDEYHRIEILPNGRKILWVFQTKIVALPMEDRWKPIPILFDEQHFALKMIESKCFKRPLLKTLRDRFGNRVTCYAGRKGFTDLMLARGQTLENITVWKGHSSLARTWKSYKQRRKFHLPGF